jgi:hypothetical protein
MLFSMVMAGAFDVLVTIRIETTVSATACGGPLSTGAELFSRGNASPCRLKSVDIRLWDGTWSAHGPDAA